ncbi:N-formyl peptide receptor 3-like [Bufo gargarizans]|uniref:N-formyl peptide receptor 3-like n=1 Tax=Bufo gargarizans TaxID=30331 RepID=UPI001CF25FE7|nr:N-formyl peptide receptor 3-like [Bufo gargarizans]
MDIWNYMETKQLKAETYSFEDMEGGNPSSLEERSWEVNNIDPTLEADLVLWRRYIDDILYIWGGTQENLDKFIGEINDNRSNLKFTSNIGGEKVEFLDIEITRRKNRYLCNTFHKPTAKNGYIPFSSCHLPRWLTNIPFGQFRRLKRNCTEEDKFEEEAIGMSNQFKEKNYPDVIINEALVKVKELDRKTFFKPTQESRQENNSYFRIILPYNNQAKQINILTGPTMMMNGTISNPIVKSSTEMHYDNDTLANSFKCRTHLQIFQLVVYSVVCLVGTTGNGLVIWFSLFRMEKTVNVVWFLNLSITDFTFALLLLFPITSVALDNHWPFSKFMCKFIWFLLFLSMAISVLQLTVISVDRCLCVTYPVWCHNHRTRTLALIVVLIIWIVSIASALPSYIFGDTVATNNTEKIYCCFINSDIIWIHISKFFFFIIVPFIVIVSSYTVIFLRIKDKRIIKSSKPFKVIIAVVIAFFVCWFPYYVFLLINLFHPGNDNSANKIGYVITLDLMYLNCCINPILYVFIGRDFKQNFCGSLQAMFEMAFREDMNKL